MFPIVLANAAATPVAALTISPSETSPGNVVPARAPNTQFLERPGGRIAYDDTGVGPLVIMVPGLGDIRAEYRFLAPQVVAAGYRVVTMDLRGHGESSTGWADYSAAALGGDVAALIDHLAAGPAIVIGTSRGAGAATWAAVVSPDKVSALVLIGPFVRKVPPASWWSGLAQTVMIKTAFVGPWAVSAWGSYFTTLFPASKPADFAAYKTRLLANLAEPGRMAALKAMIDPPADDAGADLARIHVPTLVVMGSRDPDFSDAAAEAAAIAGLLHGSVRMIDGAGHYPHAEMPEITGPLVVDFLSVLRAS